MQLFINHKSNLTLEEIKLYERTIKDFNVVVFPSLCYLPIFNEGKYKLGAQDVSEYIDGEKTGEINVKQLKGLNVTHLLIGHRDRRIYKKENQNILLKKLKICIDNNIIPLYCLSNNYKKNKDEIDKILKKYKNKEILFVYEPYNNIGKSTPNLMEIKKYSIDLKEYVYKKYKKKIKIVCGGGININNIEEIKTVSSIDGIIISSSILTLDNIKNIYKTINT